MPVTINGSAGVTTNSGAVYDGIQRGNAQAMNGFTFKEYSGIPSWVKRITVMFDGISTNGTSNYLIQLGTSGGIETSNYVSTSSTQSGVTTGNSTIGFLITVATSGTSLYSGIVTLTNINNTSWVSSGLLKEGTTTLRSSAGNKTLSDTLARIRITTVNGTDTFNAGSVNILYE